MSAGSSQRSEEQFLCSICLDVFSDPVSTPCGHNFCKACINQHWDVDARYQCPLCKEMFHLKPELHVNTLLAELADEVRRSAGDAVTEQQAAEPQTAKTEVPPDVGTSRKSRLLWVVGALFLVLAYMMHNRQLVKTDQLSQENQLKIEIKLLVERSKEDVGGDRAVAALTESLQRRHAELLEMTKNKQRTEMKTEDLFKELERLIPELKKKREEVEELVAKETEKESPKVPAGAALKKARRYAVDVTLDPGTAHPSLVLSDDGKRVSSGGLRGNFPDNPERFSHRAAVLGKQSFSSYRFYFEVRVKGRSEWGLGVAEESIRRKGDVALTPQNGCWSIRLRDGGRYEALATPPVLLSLQSPPERVGVFVDYEEGLVSFYDVDAEALIYSFSDRLRPFTDRLRPFFSVIERRGMEASAPLIITSV